MKDLKLFILVCLWFFLPLSLMAQKQAKNSMNAFEDDYLRLESAYANAGSASDEYLTQLRNFSIVYTDTCYRQFYPRIAKAILKGSDATKRVCGVDSEEFRMLMVNLNKTLVGKYFVESNYSSYGNDVINYVETLANDIPNCSNKNKLEFATILCGLYQLFKIDYQKALEYGKLKYRLTREMYDVDSDYYAYAICDLIKVYGKLNQLQESKKLISEYLKVCSSNAVSRDHELANVLNALSTNIDPSVFETLLKEYALGFGDVNDIMLLALQCATDGNAEILSLVEKWVIPSQENEISVFDFYQSVGVVLGSSESNPQLAIDYLRKAIDYSSKHNLKNYEFREYNGTKMDLWANIGVNYQRLNDYKNAARSFLTSARNIRESYPADLNSIKRCIDAAVIDYVQYYQPIANKSSIKDEVHSFVVEYSFVGDLKGLYNLYCEFIYAEDDDALSAVEAFVIPKETDNDQILDFYIGVAEQSFHDELYQKSADYNMKAIIQSEISMQPMSAYFEYDGVKHSRWEYIAYCLTKVGDFEGAVNAYLNNVASVGRNLGSESVEYNQSMELLYHVASDEKMGPILDRILKEKGY